MKRPAIAIAMLCALSANAQQWPPPPGQPVEERCSKSLGEMSIDELIRAFSAGLVPRVLIEDELLLRGSAAVPALIDNLVANWNDEPTRQLLVRFAKRSPQTLVEELFAAGDESRRRVIQGALEGVGDDGVSALTAAIDKPDGPARRVVVELVSRTGTRACGSLAPLTRAMASEDPATRAAAVTAIGSCGPRAAEALGEVGRLLHDEDEDVRWEAVEAVKLLGAAAEPLEPALRAALAEEENDENFRELIEEALHEIEHGERLTIAEFDREIVRAQFARTIYARHGTFERAAAAAPEEQIEGFRIADRTLWQRLAESLGDRQRLPFLRKSIKSPDLRIRLGAASAIFRIPGEEDKVSGILIAALDSDDTELQLSLLDILWQQSWKAAPAIPTLVRLVDTTTNTEVHDTALRLLLVAVPSDPIALPLLERALASPKSWERAMAAGAIATLDAKGFPYVARITELTSEDDRQVRDNAFAALGDLSKSGATDAVTALATALGSADVEQRRAAALALFHSGAAAKGAEPALVRAVSDSDSRAAAYAIAALSASGLGSRDAIEAVASAYVSERPDVWRGAGEALLKARQLEILARALSAPSANVRADATVRLRNGISWYGRRDRSSSLGGFGIEPARVVAALKPMLGNEAVEVRRATLDLLGMSGAASLEFVDMVCARLADESDAVRRAAVGAIAAIGSVAAPAASVHLVSTDARVRLGVLEALGQIREIDEVAASRAAALLGDPEIDVALRAVMVLQFAGDRGVRALISATGSANPRARRLAAWALRWPRRDGAVVAAALHRSLGDRDTEVRRAAADSLGMWGTGGEIARSTLVAMLSDEDPQVRVAAGRALRRIDAFTFETLSVALRDERTRGGAAEAIGSLYDRAAQTSVRLEQASRGTTTADRERFETARRRVKTTVRFLAEVTPPVLESWERPASTGSWSVEAELVVLENGRVDLVRLKRGDGAEVNAAVTEALRRAVFEPGRDGNGNAVPVYLDVLVTSSEEVLTVTRSDSLEPGSGGRTSRPISRRAPASRDAPPSSPRGAGTPNGIARGHGPPRLPIL